MKLSEAIRLGSMLRPQCKWDSFRNGGSCAFGAAMEAISIPTGSPRITWPWVEQPLTCPVCQVREDVGAAVVSSHLNDAHGWTREAIADWVASVEPREEQTEISGQGPRIATLEALLCSK